MSEDVLVLDADSIAYKAAAANEKRSIKTIHTRTREEEFWENRTAFKKEIEGGRYDSLEMYEIHDVQDARHSSYGQSLIREMIKGYHNRTNVKTGEIYIGGKDNFRDLIPLPMEHLVTVGKYAGSALLGGKYKGKREDTIRPLQLKELRQWMIDGLGAIVVNGMEVDDKGSIRAYEGWKAKKGRIIQVTEDKDALQCSGWLFNPAKMTQPVLIQGFGELHREGKGIKGTGRLWLYFQSVYGDKVDCYHGSDMWKIEGDKQGIARQYGEVAAFNLLKDCTTDKEALAAVYKQYQEWYPSPVTYTAHDGVIYTKDALQIMDMYVECAFMRRWDDDRIDVPAMLGKLGVI
jgi:hypothetical protein